MLGLGSQEKAARQLLQIESLGFHQFGSSTSILPRIVPIIRFLQVGACERTISTTGTPRRQMVTSSPFSTTLINPGSLFLASDKLTCMIALP